MYCGAFFFAIRARGSSPEDRCATAACSPSVSNGVLWGTAILLLSSTPTTWVPAPAHISQLGILISTPLGILWLTGNPHAQGCAGPSSASPWSSWVRLAGVARPSTIALTGAFTPGVG